MDDRLVIVADDFTGAGDSAVQFVSTGRTVRLLVSSNSAARTAAVSVVNTNSRFLSPRDAYTRVQAAVKALYTADIPFFFKKIDSVLRGNPEDECAAVMDALSYRSCLLCSAAPRNGRIIKDGICYVSGIALAESSLASDPFNPRYSSYPVDYFKRRFEDSIYEIKLDLLRSSKELLCKLIQKKMDEGIRLFSADAESMDDLYRLSTLRKLPDLLFAGASGLAEALAADYPEPCYVFPSFNPKDLLFVIASMHPVSGSQCARLVEATGLCELVINTEALLIDPQKERNRLLKILESLPRDKALLLRSSALDNDRVVPTADTGSAARVSSFFASFTKECMDLRSFNLVFASGGDIAAAVTEALDMEYMDYLAEMSPGIPFGVCNSSTRTEPFYFVSKSGSFGSKDSLEWCYSVLTGEKTGGPE